MDGLDEYIKKQTVTTSTKDAEAKEKIFKARDAVRQKFGTDIPDDVVEDFYNTTYLESGRSHYNKNGSVKMSPPDPKDGQRAIGWSQIKEGTIKQYNLDPMDETQNIMGGLKYFYDGDPTDPVSRRIAYFSGHNSGSQKFYKRTGEIPSGGDFTGTSFNKYIQGTGGFNTVDDYIKNGVTTKKQPDYGELDAYINQPLTNNTEDVRVKTDLATGKLTTDQTAPPVADFARSPQNKDTFADGSPTALIPNPVTPTNPVNVAPLPSETKPAALGIYDTPNMNVVHADNFEGATIPANGREVVPPVPKRAFGQKQAKTSQAAKVNQTADVPAFNSQSVDPTAEQLAEAAKQFPADDVSKYQTPVVEAKSDADILNKGGAGEIAVDLANKPKGVNADDYLVKQSLQSVAAKYNLTDAEIDNFVANRTDRDQAFSALTDERIARHVKDNGNYVVGVNVRNDAVNQILNARSGGASVNNDLVNPELKTQIGLQENQIGGLDKNLNNESLIRQAETNATPEGRLRAQAEENVMRSGLVRHDDTNIEKEYQRLKKLEDEKLSPETDDILKQIGYGLNLGGQGTPNAGGGNAIGGAIGALGSTAYQLGGLNKYSPVGIGEQAANSALSYFGFAPNNPYSTERLFRNLGEGGEIIDTASTQYADTRGKIANFLGKQAIELPKFIGVTALTGGNVVLASALLSGSESAGRGNTLSQVGGDAAKGAVFGALLEGGSVLGKAVENGLVNGATKDAATNLVGWIAGNGVRVGTVTGGSFIAAKAEGADNETASIEALKMLLLDIGLGGREKMAELGKLSGKVVREWKDGAYKDYGFGLNKNGELNVYDLTGKNLPSEAVQSELIEKPSVSQKDELSNKNYETKTAEVAPSVAESENVSNAEVVSPGATVNNATPERDITLAAQEKAASDEKSSSAAVLYPRGENLPDINTNKFFPAETKNGDVLIVNENKIQKYFAENNLGAYGRGKAERLIGEGKIKATDLVGGKAKEFEDTSGGAAVVTVDKSGNELVASKISDNPVENLTDKDLKTVERQTELDRQRFGDGVKTQIVPTDEVAASRIEDRPIERGASDAAQVQETQSPPKFKVPDEIPQAEKTKERSLPKTLRDAGMEADAEIYKVFGDKEALKQADDTFNNLGIEKTIKELENKSSYDKADALLSFKAQRVLLNEASKADSSGNAEYAQELRARSQELVSKHAELATKAGQFNQAAAIVAQTVDGVVFRANKIAAEKGKSLPKAASERFQELGITSEQDFNQLEIHQAEVIKLRERIAELEAGKSTPLERFSVQINNRAKSSLPDRAALKQKIIESLKSELGSQAGAVVIKPAKPFDKTPDDLKQYGASVLLDKPLGEIKREDFNREMVSTFGARIKDNLPQIFADSLNLRNELLKKALSEHQAEKLKAEFPDASEKELQEISNQRNKKKEARRATGTLAKRLASLYSPIRAKEIEKIIITVNSIANNPDAAGYAERILTKETSASDLARSNRNLFSEANRLIEQAKEQIRTDKDSIKAEILAGKDNLRLLEREEFFARAKSKATVAELAREYRRLEETPIEFYGKEGLKILGETRSVLASGDLSGSLRQGFYFTVTNPVLMLKGVKAENGEQLINGAFKGMFESFSENKHADLIKQIENHPEFDTMVKMGIEFADAGTNFSALSGAEENIRTEYAKKIPILKSWLGVSERTYSGFLDTQRALTADSVIKELQSQGLTMKNAKAEYEAAAKLINIGTGRGNISSNKMLEGAISSFGRALFAPRYAVSRFQLLNHLLNPAAIAKMPPASRQIAMKRALRFHAAISLPLLAAGAMGAISLDADDDDFLKIRVGSKARYETTGGLQTYLRFLGQMGKATYRAAAGTSERGLANDLYYSNKNFWSKKLAPIPSYGYAAFSGKEADQTEFNWLKGITNRLTPITVREFSGNTYEDGALGFALTLPSIFGIGLSYYPDRTPASITKEILDAKKTLTKDSTADQRKAVEKKIDGLNRKLAEMKKKADEEQKRKR